LSTAFKKLADSSSKPFHTEDTTLAIKIKETSKRHNFTILNFKMVLLENRLWRQTTMNRDILCFKVTITDSETFAI